MVAQHILSDAHNHGFSESDTYGAYKIFFGTLVSESRLKIINLLRGGRKNVSQIMGELGMDQTATSHDLSRLKLCGFVNVEVVGKFRYYTLNDDTIKPLMDIIDAHMKGNCVHILHSKKGGHDHEGHNH
jgi:DNA-binding transcriptional ArsR family regulator